VTLGEQRTIQAFILTAPWQHTPRGTMATVWLTPDAISPECMPPGVRVDEVMWDRRDHTDCVPVRLVRK
jgi:hypothetical protein